MKFPKLAFRRVGPRGLAVLTATGILATLPALARAEAAEVNIDPSSATSPWKGWGCSLAWWAHVFGGRDDLADLFFTRKTVRLDGQTLPGLGLNIVRYNAGACGLNVVDGQKIALSQNIPPERRIEGFWLDGKDPDPKSPGWNQAADQNQVAMLLKARDRGATDFELFSNSPMWWMCANRNPSGDAKGGDNLPPASFRGFAEYLAGIAQIVRDRHGLTFTTVEPFNEPRSNWWKASNNQEGCHFSADSQAKIIALLRAELDQHGLDKIGIAASDENTYDVARATWQSFSPSTKSAVSRLNVHGYQGGGGRRDLLFDAAAGKEIWNTEYGEGEADGAVLARNLCLDFRYLHPTAWCYWQPLDTGGWGLIQVNLSKRRIGAVNQKFFVLAQFTRHIRPGMTIFQSSDDNTVVAFDAPARRLVLVTANFEGPRSIVYDLSRFQIDPAPVVEWSTGFEGETRYVRDATGPVRDRKLSSELPAKSIRTFEISNVSLGSP